MNKEHLSRKLALKLFNAPKGNRNTILEMSKDNPYYNGFGESFEWGEIMEGWETISKFRSDNSYPDGLEEGEILIDEMVMGGRGATIRAMQVKNGKWVTKGNSRNWTDYGWVSYNAFVRDNPDASNSDSLKEAICKTVTDFAIWWCKENIPDLDLEF